MAVSSPMIFNQIPCYKWDPILENRQCTHFVINRNIKTMGKIQKSNNKIMQVIDCLDSQWVNALIIKSWVSLCSPAHLGFENLCFVLVLELVLELWPFVHVVVTMELMDNLFSVNTPSLSGMKIYGLSSISWRAEKFLVNKMS